MATDTTLPTSPSSQPPTPASPYLTAAEAAEYLRTTRGTIYNLVWRGVLPRRRGKLLFTRKELDDYLAGKTKLPAAKKRDR